MAAYIYDLFAYGQRGFVGWESYVSRFCCLRIGTSSSLGGILLLGLHYLMFVAVMHHMWLGCWGGMICCLGIGMVMIVLFLLT